MAGIPYTETNMSLISYNFDMDSIYIAPYNKKRYSPYQSFDIKIAKGVSIKNSKGHFYLEVWNSFNKPNSFLTDNKTKEYKMYGFNLPTTAIFLGLDFTLYKE